MTTPESPSHSSSFLQRLLAGALPLGIVCVLLWASFAHDKSFSPSADIPIFILCAIVLWFGWKAIRSNLITKWIGYILGAYVALVVGSIFLGLAIGSALWAGILAPLIILALPIVAYDLLFRAPREGSLARMKQDPTNSTIES